MAEASGDTGKDSVAITIGGKTTRRLGPGDIVGESYRIISLLGRGAMGYVFRAEHIIIGQEYALKMLAPDQINEMTWNRFQLEGKAIARLDHANIVKIYNMGIDRDEIPYYVMDILEGVALSDRVSKNNLLSLDEVLDIFIQLTAGFGYAHNRGIIHRDIKPSNIMLIDGGNRHITAKIVDFGIAKVETRDFDIQSQTATGEIFGSPYYMSPEQCLGGRIDQRSDIYSLGCTLFEALCGRPPFAGETAMQTVMMHQNKPSPTLESAGGRFSSDEMEALVAKMLMKRPTERYQTMEQVGHDLERIRENKAVGKNVDTGFVSSVDSQLEELGAKYAEERLNRLKLRKLLSITCGAALFFAGLAFAWVCYTANKPQARVPQASPTGGTVTTHEYSQTLGHKDPGLQAAEAKIAAAGPIVSTIDKDGNRIFTCPDVHIGAFGWSKKPNGCDYDALSDGRQDAFRTVQVPANKPIMFTIEQGRNRETFLMPQVLKKFGAREMVGLRLQANNNVEEIGTPAEKELETNQIVSLVKAISGWTNCQIFEFFNLSAPNQALAELDNHKELRSFGLYDSSVDFKYLSQRSFLRSLEKLYIAHERGCDPLLEALKGSRTLQSISLQDCSVSASAFDALSTCPNLKNVRLENLQVDNRSLEALARIKSLRLLSLIDLELRPDQIEILSKFRFVKDIALTVGWPQDKAKLLKLALPQARMHLPSSKTVSPSEI